MPSAPHRPPMTVQTGSAHLNVSPRFLRREIQQGRLPVIRLGRMIRLQVEDLDAYLDAHRLVRPDNDEPSAVNRDRLEPGEVVVNRMPPEVVTSECPRLGSTSTTHTASTRSSGSHVGGGVL